MKAIKIFRVAILIALMIGFLSAGAVYSAQYFQPSGSGYKAWRGWCASIGGTSNQDPNNPVCTPPSSPRYSYSPGRSFQEQMISSMTPALQNAISGAIQALLFGNPAEEARRQEEMRLAAIRAAEEQARIEAEQRRIAEERHRRLISLLIGFQGRPQLDPMGVEGRRQMGLMGVEGRGQLNLMREQSQPVEPRPGTAFFGIPGNPPGELQLRSLEEERGQPSSSPIEQLRWATYLSKKAANAGSSQDAEVFADAAFTAATGGEVDIRDVPEVEGVPVSEVHLLRLGRFQEAYEMAINKAEGANEAFARAEHSKKLAEEAKRVAERKYEEQKAKIAAIPADQQELRRQEDDKLAEAQRLLNEAIRFDEMAATELEKATRDAETARRGLSEVEARGREFVRELRQ